MTTDRALLEAMYRAWERRALLVNELATAREERQTRALLAMVRQHLAKEAA